MTKVKIVKGANCKDCSIKQSCNFLKEGHAECVSSLSTGFEIACCDYEKERRDIFDIMTEEEIANLKRTHNCPICGYEFVGYPTGWAWENHIRDCLDEKGRT